MIESLVMFEKRLIVLTALLFMTIFCRCASKGSRILEPADSDAVAKADEKEIVNSKYDELMSVLGQLGYEGVGLQFENDSSLEFLIKLFSDPRMRDRKLRLIYTGLEMSYDARHQSLTIGGTRELEKIFAFIDKNVPK